MRRSNIFSTILVVVIVGLIIAALAAHHLHSSTSTTSSTLFSTTTTSTAPPTTLPHSTTTTVRATPSAILPSQAAFPAYQHLPYDGGTFIITVNGSAPHNKIDVLVFSQVLSVAQEKSVYQAFLGRYHDSGTKYVPAYSSTVPAAH